MKRHRLSKGYSKRNFSYSALKIDKRNLGGHARGGWTL